jgi:hypothetical protein
MSVVVCLKEEVLRLVKETTTFSSKCIAGLLFSKEHKLLGKASGFRHTAVCSGICHPILYVC